MTRSLGDQYDDMLDRMFKEQNAKHPPEFQFQSHQLEQNCPATHDGFTCTLIAGHTCDHVSHGRLGYIHHRWNQAGEEVSIGSLPSAGNNQ